MKLETIHELFIMQIKDLYSSETQLIQALPKMAEVASNETLKQGIEEHLKETEEQAKRLEQIAEELEFNPRNHVCRGMQGLIEESREYLKAEGEPSVIDAGLVAAAQRVEHYEIAGYGTVLTLAELMGHKNATKLLNQTLEEEKKADEKLTMVAEKEVNPEALKTTRKMV